MQHPPPPCQRARRAGAVRPVTDCRIEFLATKAERVTSQAGAGTTLYDDDRWEPRHAPGL